MGFAALNPSYGLRADMEPLGAAGGDSRYQVRALQHDHRVPAVGGAQTHRWQALKVMGESIDGAAGVK